MDTKRLMMSMAGMSALFGLQMDNVKAKKLGEIQARDRRLKFKPSRRSISLKSRANRRKAKRLK